MIIYIVLLTALISTALGGMFAMRFTDKLHLISGFGAGAILGVALFDLLPESIKLIDGNYDLLVMPAIAALGFCIFMIIDRVFSLHAHNDENCKKRSHSSKFGALAIILHSFIDGFGIGIAFKISPAAGFAVAIAVLIHGFADGINTVSMIMKNKTGNKSAAKWLIANAIAPVLGGITAYMLTISEPTLGLILALFFGIFLYISASDLIPESHHNHPTMWTTGSTILGLLLILIAIVFSS